MVSRDRDVGFFLFRPLLLVAIIAYFFVRKKVRVEYSVRRDVRSKRRWTLGITMTVTLALMALGI